ncbi:NAD(P)/FAD-dependent oxidoreductase [Microbacterium sulfonylureivorans]|uniref:NAD(P)/FAD-dependent oxidoreductase n=1 Tax=Microbacterium sulfonylureivorans TaxID=2486854 RepID=UPI000FD9405B|nr:NAD(P)/FAD-dependent oxidoreductase [Microbacterium sulfonylureivorans]
MYEAIVIGGGPAGLQAALTLGRMHRRTLLVDSGEYRNGTVEHAHNLLANDGVAPAELRARARTELVAYPTVEVRDAAVESVVAADGGFTIALADGEVVRAARVVLATGVRDELPPIPGLAAEWGRRVAQCPFCHGHEFAGRAVAVALDGEHAEMIRRMLAPLASEVVVIPPGSIERIVAEAEGLRIETRDGTARSVAGLFVAPTPSQRAPFAERLGCRMLPSGAVEVDLVGATSVPGVYAAGDMAHTAAAAGPMVSLAAAIAAGQMAAAGVVRDLTSATA